MPYTFKLGTPHRIYHDTVLVKVVAPVLCEKSDQSGFIRKSRTKVTITSDDVPSFTVNNVKQAIVNKLTANNNELANQLKAKADIAVAVETRDEFSVADKSLNVS